MDKFGEKLKKFISSDDDYTEELDVVEEEDEEEVKATSSYEEPKQKGVTKTDAKMLIFEPRSYEDATTIADYLKVGKACVVNIHRLQNEYRQRLIDFLWGTVYALDGKIQKVGTDVFLCTPKGITVNGQVEDPVD